MQAFEKVQNSVLQEDIEEIAKYSVLDRLEDGSTILVTGATGLIGSLIVKSLAHYKVFNSRKIKIIALLRNEEKAKKIFGALVTDHVIDIYVHDIMEPITLAESVDYIVHGASATSSKYFVEKPVETIDTALNGTKNILEFAKAKKSKKIVYLSSLEVYGVPDGKKEYITEKDFGYIDPMTVRSSYSEGKRMAECICVSYAKEYDVPVVVARLSQTFGAGVTYNDGRVFAEFARCAIEKRNIILHTQGNTVRSYCYTTDAVKAIICLLLDGNPGEAYNVTNMDTVISIKDMAHLVVSLIEDFVVEVEFDIPEDIGVFGYNPEMAIRLDSKKLQELGWLPSIGLKEMYKRLIASMIADLHLV